MKIIKINKCFDDCPHCTGPDYNRKNKLFMYTCQEIPEWIENEDIIPDWCPLEDGSTIQLKAENKVCLNIGSLPRWKSNAIIGKKDN